MRFSLTFFRCPLALLTCGVLYAGDGQPRYSSVTTGGTSPQRDILVEYDRSDRPGMSPVAEQIWLVSTSDPANRRLLFAHEREASVLFSDDEEWLAINDHCLSNESRLLLYRRKGPLEYAQVADLSEAAWRFFNEQQGRKVPTGFDHHYVEALRWAEHEPPTLLLALDGHIDSRNQTSEWYCFYNIQTKSFSTDLAGHNQRSTALESE